MGVPSIKGTAFVSAVDDVRRLLDEGRIAPEVLEAKLRPPDLLLLDEKINPAAWYPIDAYERLVALLVEREAGGDPDAYLVERGRRAGQRLARAGIYQQLDASIERSGPRVGRIIVTLAGAIYNFTRWRFVPGDVAGHGFRVEVDEAADLPEAARLTAQGFIEYTASRTTGAPYRVTSCRSAPDRVLFEAERSD